MNSKTPYEIYEGFLRSLSELDKAGKNESAEADEIRDASEKLWYKLSAAEQAKLDALSVALYEEAERRK